MIDHSDRSNPTDIPTDIGPIVSPETDLNAIKEVLQQYQEGRNRRNAGTLWEDMAERASGDKAKSRSLGEERPLPSVRLSKRIHRS